MNDKKKKERKVERKYITYLILNATSDFIKV